VFTGITSGTFPVTRVEPSRDLLRYSVKLGPKLAKGLVRGASVAIDGVCQTVVRVRGAEVDFDAIGETLDKTTLASLKVGARVSVERSFRVGDELGGHEVAGHVTGTGATCWRTESASGCASRCRSRGCATCCARGSSRSMARA
jgi:riboflavin synthase